VDINIIFLLVALGASALLAAAALLWGVGQRKQADAAQKAQAQLAQELDLARHKMQAEGEEIRSSLRLKLLEEMESTRRDAEQDIKDRRAELVQFEKHLFQKEQNLDKRQEMLETREHDLLVSSGHLDVRQQELNHALDNQKQTLERISHMSADEARRLLMEQVDRDLLLEKQQRLRQMEDEVRESSKVKAQEILGTVIQRCAVDTVVETTVAVVQLPSDEMKGRLIGREGRNIRAIETLTGCDLIVDDTPEAVVVSCFDPVRRAIGRLTVEKLVADGRIHPMKIEEIVNKSQEEIEALMLAEGQRAIYELELLNVHPEIVKTMGRMYYRSSYGQNALRHSVEVGFLAGMIAEELGANVMIARRGGLLHDLGKAIDQSQQGTHVQLGAELARRHGEDEWVVNCIESHHDDVVADSIEAVIVKVADAMSAARPGARRDTLDFYVKRLKKLEEISGGYEGVRRSFVLQAGREVRIMVEPDTVDDVAATKMARDVADRIEKEMEFPGQIRVTVVREWRATEVAM